MSLTSRTRQYRSEKEIWDELTETAGMLSVILAVEHGVKTDFTVNWKGYNITRKILPNGSMYIREKRDITDAEQKRLDTKYKYSLNWWQLLH